MNFIIGIIASVIGAISNAMGDHWTTALWCLIAAGWASLGYLESRSAKRHKAAAAARSWPQIGTVRSDGTIRNGGPGYEVWNGKVWVKV